MTVHIINWMMSIELSENRCENVVEKGLYIEKKFT